MYVLKQKQSINHVDIEYTLKIKKKRNSRNKCLLNESSHIFYLLTLTSSTDPYFHFETQYS